MASIEKHVPMEKEKISNFRSIANTYIEAWTSPLTGILGLPALDLKQKDEHKKFSDILNTAMASAGKIAASIATGGASTAATGTLSSMSKTKKAKYGTSFNGNLVKKPAAGFTIKGKKHEQGGENIITPNGEVLEVEDNEYITDSYVYSDSIGRNGLVDKNNKKDKSFADLARDIEKKYKGTDNISKNSRSRELYLLSLENEKMKNKFGGNKPGEAGLGESIKNLLSNTGNKSDQDGYTRSFLPEAIGYGLQALANIPGLSVKPEKVKYDRITPDLINLSAERDSLAKERELMLSKIRNKANDSTNVAEAMNFISGASQGVLREVGSKISDSFMREANTNADIKNKTKAMNAEIAMKEADTNAAERDAARSHRLQTMSNIGTIAGAAAKSYNSMINDVAMINATSSTGDYKLVGRNGNIKVVRRKDNNTPINNDNNIPKVFPSFVSPFEFPFTSYKGKSSKRAKSFMELYNLLNKDK